jgi:hypothetical protein
MAVAVNPYFGSYNWNLEMVERDANEDGILTVAEYAPPSPFGDISAYHWTRAGTDLRAAVTDAQTAFADRQTANPNELIMRLINNQGWSDPDIDDTLQDAADVLNGTINATVELYRLNYSTWQYELKRTVIVPLRLRDLWDTPPASFRSLLPPLYLMADWCEYDSFTLWMDDYNVGTGIATYDPEGISEASGAPHNLTNAPGETPTFDIDFNWDWSTYSGTYDGGAVSGGLASGGAHELDTVFKWADLPDPTFSGVFPIPARVETILKTTYDESIIIYGTLQLGELPW